MKIFELKENEKKYINQIVAYEVEIFGDGGIGRWTIMPFVKYGKVYVAVDEEMDKVVSAIEIMRGFDNKKAYIYGLFTEKDYLGKGYALKILDFSIKEIRKLGIKTVTLTVDPENEPAKNLYYKYGFKDAGLLKDEYGEGIDRLYMELDL